MLLRRLGDGLADCVAEGGDLEQFCRQHRDDFAVARRTYLGVVVGEAASVGSLLKGLPRGPIDPEIEHALATSIATAHVTLRNEGPGRALKLIVHVLVTREGEDAAIEYRIHPGGRTEWITQPFSAGALLAEIPPPGARRPLSTEVVQSLLTCLSEVHLVRPSIAPHA